MKTIFSYCQTRVFAYLLCCIGFIQLSEAQTFSNTTAQACGHALFTNDFNTTFSRTIAVSGLGNNLGTNAFLTQINVEIGSPSCTRNLTTYSLQIVSPSGTTYTFQSGITGTVTNQWLNTRFRDHPALERIDEYALTVQQTYWPYCIGYYQTETDNGFSTFNGEDPNGNWIFRIADNTATSGLSFSRIDLVFGATPLAVTNVELSSGNNFCAGSSCLLNGATSGNNNGYSQVDPLFPGTTVDGCNWNGANNNSAWFHFYPSGTTATITISGIHGVNGSGTAVSNATQPIILEAPAVDNCTTTPNQVPTGGCPEGSTAINNCYINSSDPYVNGISANAEFSLTGLTPGAKYYLYIDGNGNIANSFYIELTGSNGTCNTLLPIEWLSFTGENLGRINRLDWATAKEENNHLFEIERSFDGVNFQKIGEMQGHNNTENAHYYSFEDINPYNGSNYYRLKQIDFDNNFSYSNTIVVETAYDDDIHIYPNPSNGEITISIQDRNQAMIITDIVGRIVITDNKIPEKLDCSPLASGVYFLKTKYRNIKFIKN